MKTFKVELNYTTNNGTISTDVTRKVVASYSGEAVIKAKGLLYDLPTEAIETLKVLRVPSYTTNEECIDCPHN